LVRHINNGDVSSRASKRTHGRIYNIARQLAQIAAGWQAAIDRTHLLGEPTTGSYVINLVSNVATINGRVADLAMTTVLSTWLQGELDRLSRDRDWLSKAVVEVTYELVPGEAFMGSHPGYWTSQAFVVQLSATVSVSTADGTAEASFRNAQAVIGLTS